MRRLRIIAFVITLLACATSAGVELCAQTTIGGVVNRYIQVLELVPCDSSVRVANPSQFSPGDLVLMIQMKGAQIGTKNDPQFGTIADIAGAGSLEFLTIKTISNDWFVFASKMVNAYDVSGMIQIVKVPIYDNARVTSPLSAPDWNGTIGGVVVIQVNGDLTLNSNITVTGKGFRGGKTSVPEDVCDVGDYVNNWTTGLSGMKGEGIAIVAPNFSAAGRGPLANGGGGGNGNNAGGAGGTNGGEGGNGGDANKLCRFNRFVGGLPGASLTPYIFQQKLFFGGGGGGSHQNQANGTNGSNGGGIIIIRSKTIHGSGYTISANALNVLDTADLDGCGGGGAGGTILIETDTILSPVFLDAAGGDGGNNKNNFEAHGPGGGGGGGMIILNKPQVAINIDVTPGMPGIHTNPENVVYKSQWNATQGDTGVFLDGGWTWKKPYTIELAVSGGAELCPGEKATLVASPGFSSYKWSNGETTQTIEVSQGGTYTVETIDAIGCVHRSRPLSVTYDPIKYTVSPNVDFGKINYGSNSSRNIVVTNTDDEPIELFEIRGADVFQVTNPLMFPVTIPAGQQLLVEVSIRPTEAKAFADTLTLIFSKPCPASSVTTLAAYVDPIAVQFVLPDTSGIIGTSEFIVPLRTTVWPDDMSLPSTEVNIKISMDSRLYAPTSAEGGAIIGDIIDRITNKRTITVRMGPVTLDGTDQTPMRIVGTLLAGTVHSTPLTIDSVEFISVVQQPTVYLEDGSITTDTVCFQQGRQIRFFHMPTIDVMPNPASEVVTVDATLSIRGNYDVVITDLLGQQQFKESWYHEGHYDLKEKFAIDVSEWGSGSYILLFKTPVASETRRIVVE